MEEYLTPTFKDDPEEMEYIESLQKARCMCCNREIQIGDYLCSIDKVTRNLYAMRILKPDSGVTYCRGCKDSNQYLIELQRDLNDEDIEELTSKEETLTELIFIEV